MEAFEASAEAGVLKRRVMRRVYAVWFWKSAAPLLAVELVMLAGVAVGVLTHISVRHIMQNALAASADARAFIQFFINNFFVKSVQSQLLAGVYAVVTFFFVRDIRRAIQCWEVPGRPLGLLSVGGNRR